MLVVTEQYPYLAVRSYVYNEEYPRDFKVLASSYEDLEQILRMVWKVTGPVPQIKVDQDINIWELAPYAEAFRPLLPLIEGKVYIYNQRYKDEIARVLPEHRAYFGIRPQNTEHPWVFNTEIDRYFAVMTSIDPIAEGDNWIITEKMFVDKFNKIRSQYNNQHEYFGDATAVPNTLLVGIVVYFLLKNPGYSLQDGRLVLPKAKGLVQNLGLNWKLEDSERQLSFRVASLATTRDATFKHVLVAVSFYGTPAEMKAAAALMRATPRSLVFNMRYTLEAKRLEGKYHIHSAVLPSGLVHLTATYPLIGKDGADSYHLIAENEEPDMELFAKQLSSMIVLGFDSEKLEWYWKEGLKAQLIVECSDCYGCRLFVIRNNLNRWARIFTKAITGLDTINYTLHGTPLVSEEVPEEVNEDGED